MDYARFSFHPVGQGIFSSGALCFAEPYGEQFCWVYDCGTVKRWQRQLEQEVDRFASLSAVHGQARPRLELLFLSHFDLDHISGLVALLGRFDVGALVLPYVPLWQRLAVSFGSKRFDNATSQAFFVDPIRFVSEIDGANVERIILVPPSTGQVPDDGPDGAPLPGGAPQDQPPLRGSRITKDLGPLLVAEDEVTGGRVQTGSSPAVMWLQPGGRLTAHDVWEFIPYNDPKLQVRATPSFRLKVRRLRGRLLATTSQGERASLLADLKSTYSSTFGKSAKRKNEISLFVYGGPTRAFNWRSTLATAFPSLAKDASAAGACESGMCNICTTDEGAAKPAILYTGDGYLASRPQLTSLSQYLGAHRMSRVGTLQVMHHGARGNWFSGLASALQPEKSVFCADKRHHHGHPHNEVWDDFSPFGAARADSLEGLSRFLKVDAHPV